MKKKDIKTFADLTTCTDFLIIGAGLAGLYTTNFLKEHGQVTLITKGSLRDSNSYLAQGGIAAAINDYDSIEAHLQDTLIAGNYVNNLENTQILIKQGKEQVLDLIDLGVEFDRDAKGAIHFTREGAHSKNRILHASGDSTGQVICDKLIELITAHPNVQIYEYAQAISLLAEDKFCDGALAYHLKNNELMAIQASRTILATGGLTGIYTTSTANPTVAGDGLILARNAGARLKDLQFIQFHPTALATAKAKGFLISEALRGEGAYLVNSHQQRFMEKYHPLKELAPRHLVSQAIWREINNSEKKYVYLDTTHLSTDYLAQRFPKIFKTCQQEGFTLGKDLVPVRPAAHYTIGGVATNAFGETDVANLLAIGEVAHTGVHGSNRLASNSLLECLVFSKRAAKKITLPSIKNSHANNNLTQLAIDKLIQQKISQLNLADSAIINRSPDNDQIFNQVHAQIRNLIYQHLGIVKIKEDIIVAKKELEILKNNLSLYEFNPIDQINLTTLLELAMELATSVLTYKTNSGCHYLISKKTKKGALDYAENT